MDLFSLTHAMWDTDVDCPKGSRARGLHLALQYTNTRYTGEASSRRGGRQGRDKEEARGHQPECELRNHVVQTGDRPMGVEEGAEADGPSHVHRCNPNL